MYRLPRNPSPKPRADREPISQELLNLCTKIFSVCDSGSEYQELPRQGISGPIQIPAGMEIDSIVMTRVRRAGRAQGTWGQQRESLLAPFWGSNRKNKFSWSKMPSPQVILHCPIRLHLENTTSKEEKNRENFKTVIMEA